MYGCALSAQLIAVFHRLIRPDQNNTALTVCAEHQDLRHEIGDLSRGEVHNGQNLPAHKLLRLIQLGYLSR